MGASRGQTYGASRGEAEGDMNLVDRRVEVYSDPSPSGYRSRQDYHAGESIPISIGGNQLSPIVLNDILP